MKVFVTGASGFVGTAVVEELLQAGHQVFGLARSEKSAKIVKDLGAEVVQGDLEDLESLRKAAGASDAVIHTAFIHDFSNFEHSCEVDRKALETMGAELAKGSGKILLFSSGIGLLKAGRKGKESDDADVDGHVARRAKNEFLGLSFAEQGVKTGVVRLPPSVHGAGDHGFVPTLIQIARDKGVSAFVGEVANTWSAVHRKDAAKVYRLGLEKANPNARWHAVAEEEIPFRDIAEVIGKTLKIPVKAISKDQMAEHFAWFARFATMEATASSAYTRKTLGWTPTHATLLEDLAPDGAYFKATPGSR